MLVGIMCIDYVAKIGKIMLKYVFFSTAAWLQGQWQTTPVFLPGEPQGQGAWWLLSMGSHRVGYD